MIMTNRDKTEGRDLLSCALTGLAAISSFSGLLSGFILLWKGQTASASLAFTVGLLLLLFSQFERFEFVKGFGIEAKLKRLDNKIEEADKINAALKDITGTLSQLAFELMSRIGRMNGPIGRKENLQIQDGLLRQMAQAGIPQAEIDRVATPFRKIVLYDILHPALEEVRPILSKWGTSLNDRLQQVTQQQGGTSSAEYQAILTDKEKHRRLTEIADRTYLLGVESARSNEIRQVIVEMREIEALQAFAPSMNCYQTLDDYDFYIRENRHRDVARWLSTSTQ